MPHNPLFLQLIIIIGVARLCGLLLRYVDQPPIIGEMAAGFLLGPIVFGAWFPDIHAYLFAPAALPGLTSLSTLGLVLFMFIVGAELRAPTEYRGSRNVQMKIFLMERIATWILITDGRFTARARDPFVARSRIYKLPVAIMCDALKIAYSTQGREQYKDVFLMLRRFAKRWTFQIRSSGALGLGAQPFLRTLRSYWDKKAG